MLLERPKVAAHGDVATNVAMQLAKPAKRNPRELAQAIVDALMAQPDARALVESAEIAGPGFINLRVTPPRARPSSRRWPSRGLLWPRAAHGREDPGRVRVRQPHRPAARGPCPPAALGDALCRLYDASGWDVTREFYYNDAGNQIENTAISVQARARGLTPDSPEWPADGCKGRLHQRHRPRLPGRQDAAGLRRRARHRQRRDIANLDDIRAFAVAYLRREQDLDLQAFGRRSTTTTWKARSTPPAASRPR